MDAAILGVVLDSTTVITAERRKLPVPQLIEAIQTDAALIAGQPSADSGARAGGTGSSFEGSVIPFALLEPKDMIDARMAIVAHRKA